MAKTFVIAKHAPGPAQNGHDHCFARIGYDGMCPGVQLADWLNNLGDDDEQYIKWPSGIARETNGDVRDNWLNANDHLVAREPHLATLRAEQRRLRAQLRRVEKEIKRCLPATPTNGVRP